ncbi:hypothetical protein MFIFM68171_07276 [Madurella fahalii]|uniref:DUF1993 domain-containing protein n=1 Tax=Madurella fahalii TaxID=1157608 RepID=A0ABQ0GH27_9PEZI
MTTPITAYDVSIDLHLRGLRALQQILAKAASHPSAATFPGAKLQGCDDMMPFAFHVQSCANIAQGGLERLVPATQPAGSEQAGAGLDESAAALEQLVARVGAVIDLLEKGAGPEDLRGVEGKRIELRYGERSIWWDGRGYILGYGIPNFMFHLCMAYSILRSVGVDVGKMDYLGAFMEGMTLAD